jgi:hypothetical protein
LKNESADGRQAVNLYNAIHFGSKEFKICPYFCAIVTGFSAKKDKQPCCAG